MIINIMKAPKEVRISTMRDGGSIHLDAKFSDNWVNICWINNQIGSEYKGKLFKPYVHRERVLHPVKQNELQEFTSNVTQILKHMVITNEYDTPKKAAFERELRKLSETYETYYTPSTRS